MSGILKIVRSNPYVEKAVQIDVKDIVRGEWVREACKECSFEGRSWSCPPGVGSYEEASRRLSEFSKALFLMFSSSPGRRSLERAVLNIEAGLKEAGFRKSVGFFVSPCTACESCKYPDKCPDTEKCRPTGESWGIDLLETSRLAGLEVEIVKKGEDFKPVTVFLVE